MTPLILAAVVVAASIASAFAALLLLASLEKPNRRRSASAPALIAAVEPVVFLFDGCELVDATRPAKTLLEAVPHLGSEWDRLVAYVTPKIPEFAAVIATLVERGEIDLTSPSDPQFRLHAECLGRLARLTVSDLSVEGQGVVIDGLSLHAQEEEIATLRETLGALPMPVWRCSPEGAVLWANEAYLALASEASGDDNLVWPLPVLFDLGSDAAKASVTKRMKLAWLVGGREQWFDCSAQKSGDGVLYFANPADAIVRAERSLREFVQTLTKTFAHLPIGLAIFDRQRQLALFNPALIDLTSLGADFLSARPSLFAFLDRLREARVVPEPKDYTGWRQRMTELEKAASSGHYEETWALPTGQTYKVTGRPHPDGAVAFLLEDISAEVSLTRRFRSEIEMGQSVIDALDDAVVVFSATGDLIMSNTVYTALWGIDPGATLGIISVVESTRQWQAMTRPTPAWGDLRDFVGDTSERTEWDANILLNDGSALTCLVTPMAGGATLVKFARPATGRRHVRRARKSRHNATPAGSISPVTA